jgi:hypothetical protein
MSRAPLAGENRHPPEMTVKHFCNAVHRSPGAEEEGHPLEVGALQASVDFGEPRPCDRIDLGKRVQAAGIALRARGCVLLDRS